MAVLSSASYSYSDFIYGTTNNAAANGLNWGMPTLLPESNNLSVNGVFYQYTPIKKTEDDMKVHVQNEDAVNGGYIFRETDDWSGRPGGLPITKVVGLPNVPQELWGDGSIEVEGTGSVIDTSVIYSYKYDNTCTTPLADPSCPGYLDAVMNTLDNQGVAEAYNILDDALVKDVLDDKVEIPDEELEQEEQEDEERLERVLSEIDAGNLTANTVAQAHMMKALTTSVNVQSYYNKNIQGGVYEETQTLESEQMPDNNKGARAGLAQQIMHNQMVDMQYKTGE